MTSASFSVFTGRGEILTQYNCCQGDAGTLGCSVAKVRAVYWLKNIRDSAQSIRTEGSTSVSR